MSFPLLACESGFSHTSRLQTAVLSSTPAGIGVSLMQRGPADAYWTTRLSPAPRPSALFLSRGYKYLTTGIYILYYSLACWRERTLWARHFPQCGIPQSYPTPPLDPRPRLCASRCRDFDLVIFKRPCARHCSQKLPFAVYIVKIHLRQKKSLWNVFLRPSMIRKGLFTTC